MKENDWLTGPQVARRFGISSMSLWRWARDPRLGFPAPTRVRDRNYWRLADLVEWERQAAAKSARRDR